MQYITTAVLTALFTILFLVVYKYGFNPQMVKNLKGSDFPKCPDRWSYDSVHNMCIPMYFTPCFAFNPNDPTLDSAVAKCNMARTCGTTWNKACP
jgi:hypothetical protein